jgi:ABC-type Fe3+ transport system substrate-binding protein
LQETYDSLRLPDQSLPPESVIGDTINMQLVWGGGDSFFNGELKPLGILAPLHISPQSLLEIFPQAKLAGVSLYDQEPKGPPMWVGSCLSSFGIMYNPEFYSRLDLAPPTTWSDLTDPKLAGMISLADPTQSGSAAVCYMMVIQRAMADTEAAYLHDHPSAPKTEAGYVAALSAGFKKGMGQLLLMAANARFFSDSATQPPMDICDGQAAAATAIDFYAHVYMEQVGPSRAAYVTPSNATAITPDPVAILYGTVGHKRELADHFVEFLLSKEGQRLWILKAGTPGGPRDRALRRPPIRRDLYSEDQSNWTDTTNPFAAARAFNMRGEWMALFADVRPIWAAAWIDSRDDLLRCYSAILAVPDTARRQALLSELADVPLTMQDVQADNTTRKQKEAAGNADEWKARSRLEWAEKFRRFYNHLESQAVEENNE